MRAPSRAPVSIVRYALACALILPLAGCAVLRSTVGGYATERDGISRPQQRLREVLERGDFAAALAWREDDALLRALNVGIASYHASQFARSAAVLDSAALLADDRITSSVSRNALSLVTNDMARPYQPRRTERLLIPYYALLSYARLGAWEDAAVEARRLSLLLALYADDRDDAERPLHAALGHLAGAAFERAGNRGEADVAYRAAHALQTTLPEGPASRPGHGAVLVVAERGFVAHRTTETLHLVLPKADHDSLGLDDDVRRRAMARVAARAADPDDRGEGGWSEKRPVLRREDTDSGPLALLRQVRDRGSRSRNGREAAHVDDHGYRLTISFPSLRRSAHVWPGRLRLAGEDSVGAVELRAAVDDASMVDQRREWVAFATRAVARAAAKYAVTKAVKDKKGDVAGRVANLGVSLLERADVRSWHLLPQEVALLRLPVPAGTRELRLLIGEGAGARELSLGSPTVREGEVTIVPVRLWRGTRPLVEAPTAIAAARGDEGCASIGCR